jgi:hypothetical protein
MATRKVPARSKVVDNPDSIVGPQTCASVRACPTCGLIPGHDTAGQVALTLTAAANALERLPRRGTLSAAQLLDCVTAYYIVANVAALFKQESQRQSCQGVQA